MSALLGALLSGLIGGIEGTLHNTVLLLAAIIIGWRSRKASVLYLCLVVAATISTFADALIYNYSHALMPIEYLAYMYILQLFVCTFFGAMTFYAIRLANSLFIRAKRR